MSDEAVLPYAGTSGHSGGATSEERARADDQSGATKLRQANTLMALNNAGTQGMTWKELADQTGWHHGKASGALSNLHVAEKVARLTERRDRCFVYVLPEFVRDRPTQRQGERVRPKLTEDERVVLRRASAGLYQGWVVPNQVAESMLNIIERLTGEKFMEESDG